RRPCERRCRQCPGKRERYWPRAAKTCSSAWHRRVSNCVRELLFAVPLREAADRQVEARPAPHRESGRDLPVVASGKSRQVSPPKPNAKPQAKKKRGASRNERKRIGRRAIEPTPRAARTWRPTPLLGAA